MVVAEALWRKVELEEEVDVTRQFSPEELANCKNELSKQIEIWQKHRPSTTIDEELIQAQQKEILESGELLQILDEDSKVQVDLYKCRNTRQNKIVSEQVVGKTCNPFCLTNISASSFLNRVRNDVRLRYTRGTGFPCLNKGGTTNCPFEKFVVFLFENFRWIREIKWNSKETLESWENCISMRGLPTKEPFGKKNGRSDLPTSLRIEPRKLYFTFAWWTSICKRNIHVGTRYEQDFKDIIVRSKSMSGLYAPTSQVGILWSPQSSKSWQNRVSNAKKWTWLSTWNLSFVSMFLKLTNKREDFKRLGWWLGKPLCDLDSGYEAAQIRVFGEMAKKGYTIVVPSQLTGLWSSESASLKRKLSTMICFQLPFTMLTASKTEKVC